MTGNEAVRARDMVNVDGQQGQDYVRVNLTGVDGTDYIVNVVDTGGARRRGRRADDQRPRHRLDGATTS